MRDEFESADWARAVLKQKEDARWVGAEDIGNAIVFAAARSAGVIDGWGGELTAMRTAHFPPP